ncbi:MAG: hypothetical protein PUP93_11650 [Rhizonema sp. NSF051]|nr:hypothetical protein [Rhizonema sp. NSF051]
MTFSLEQLAITDTETLEEVLKCLAENCSIKTQGTCEQKTLFEILVRAASNEDTIENTAKTLKNIPSGNDIRYHLNKIDDFVDLERKTNQALKSLSISHLLA